MKGKRLLFAVALVTGMLGWNNIQAQTDVTSTYLVNPDFEILKATDGTTDVTVKNTLSNGLFGWEVPSMSNYQVESEASGSSSGFVNGGSITPQNGTYYYFNRQGWANKNSELKTTTSQALPVGLYYAEIYYKAADYSNNNNAGRNGTTIGITVKDASDNTIGTTEAVKRAYSIANNGSNPGTNTYMKTAPWTKLGVFFEVTKESSVTISLVQNMVNSGRSDIIWDNLKLYSMTNATNADVTGLVPNYSFETGNLNAWSVNSAATGDTKVASNTENYAFSNSNGNYVFNTWHGSSVDFYVKQTINNLPKGHYAISAIVSSDNGKEVTLSFGSGSNTVQTENKETGTTVSIDDVLISTGQAEIKVSSSSWFKADYFNLTYISGLTEADDIAAAKGILYEKITEANGLNTSNVGDGVFQIPSSKAFDFTSIRSSAQEVYDNAEATLDEVKSYTEDLSDAIASYQNVALNPPAEGTKYYIKVATSGHNYFDNPIFITPGSTTANNPTGYGLNVKNAATSYLAQAFTFTSAGDAENPNDYYISIDLPEGTVYLTNGTNNSSAAGWADWQIQGTTNSDNKMNFRIVASTAEGAFNIYNTKTNSSIAAQAGGNIYTEEGNADFTVAEAVKAEVTTKIDANKFATRIYPFVPDAIGGVTYFTIEAVNGNSIILDEVSDLKANTPYILKAGNENVNASQSDFGMAGTEPYTAGYLTGVFAPKTLKASTDVKNYVLQTQKDKNGVDKQSFYIVNQSDITVPAYRAYLTVPTDVAGNVKAFNLAVDDATAINTLEVLTSGAYEGIYTVDGVKLNRMEKGVNILKMTDGTTRKVIVK